jgi:hypothetical protein
MGRMHACRDPGCGIQVADWLFPFLPVLTSVNVFCGLAFVFRFPGKLLILATRASLTLSCVSIWF